MVAGHIFYLSSMGWEAWMPCSVEWHSNVASKVYVGACRAQSVQLHCVLRSVACGNDDDGTGIKDNPVCHCVVCHGVVV